MDALEAIMSRRSIRRYTGQPVPEALIQQLLAAAMAAPSSSNRQPWHFVVITDRQLLDAIPGFHPYAAMLPEAQAAILTCGDTERSSVWTIDCSAATENLLLAAHALGLGAVWLGIYPNADRVQGIRALVELPETIMPLSLVALGYPAEHKPPAERYDPARVHYNHW